MLTNEQEKKFVELLKQNAEIVHNYGEKEVVFNHKLPYEDDESCNKWVAYGSPLVINYVKTHQPKFILSDYTLVVFSDSAYGGIGCVVVRGNEVNSVHYTRANECNFSIGRFNYVLLNDNYYGDGEKDVRLYQEIE